jgi:hypothetical protein
MKSKTLAQGSLIRIFGIPALILMLPLVLRFNWDETDFIVVGILLITVVAALELIMKKAGKYKAYAIALLLFAAAWFYVELAVGLFTNWGS